MKILGRFDKVTAEKMP